MNKTQSAKPGERWLVNLQEIDDIPSNDANKAAVTLGDYDPRTDTWTVQPDGVDGSVALLAKHLIRRLS